MLLDVPVNSFDYVGTVTSAYYYHNPALEKWGYIRGVIKNYVDFSHNLTTADDKLA